MQGGEGDTGVIKKELLRKTSFCPVNVIKLPKYLFLSEITVIFTTKKKIYFTHGLFSKVFSKLYRFGPVQKY